MNDAQNGTLKDLASGQWEYIFSVLAPELGEAMEAKPRQHVPCPVHGGSDGYRLYKDWRKTGGSVCNTCGPQSTGIRTLCWVRGWDFRTAAREVYKVLNGEEHKSFEPRPQAPERSLEEEYRYAARKNDEILARLQPAKGTAVERYLANRGLKLPPKVALYYIPDLEYWHEKQFYGKFPAMIAKVVSPEGKVIALHRTYITEDGMKAPVPEVKKLTSPSGPLTGCLIRLLPLKRAPGTKLGLAEGIETALAVHEASGMCVWPTVNTALLKGATPGVPSHAEPIVWGDLDVPQPKLNDLGAGQFYAREFARNYHQERGFRPKILLPKGPIPAGKKGVDWLDVFEANAAAMRSWLKELNLLAA